MGKPCEYLSKMTPVQLAENLEYEKKWLQYYGEMPEKLEYHQGSIYDMLYDAIRAYPKALAMEYFDVELTYRDLSERIEAVAQALLGLDVVPNESVTICMPNMPEAIFLIYAINKIGAVCNVIHPLSDHADIVNAVESTNSSLIFTTDVSALKVEGVKARVVVCEVSNSMKPLLRTAYNLKNRKQIKYPAEFIRCEIVNSL